MTDKRDHLKNAHTVFQKIDLINEARAMRNNLAQQCQEYRQRFNMCIQCGLPFIFDSNDDIYVEYRFTYI